MHPTPWETKLLRIDKPCESIVLQGYLHLLRGSGLSIFYDRYVFIILLTCGLCSNIMMTYLPTTRRVPDFPFASVFPSYPSVVGYIFHVILSTYGYLNSSKRASVYILYTRVYFKPKPVLLIILMILVW